MGMAPKYLNWDFWTSSLNISKKGGNCAGTTFRSLERIVPDQNEEINGICVDSILEPLFLYQIRGGGNIDGCSSIEIEKDSKGHDS